MNDDDWTEWPQFIDKLLRDRTRTKKERFDIVEMLSRQFTKVRVMAVVRKTLDDIRKETDAKE
jgi:hypothetical protein